MNTQLVPKLAFRILDHDKIISIQNRIWSHYTRVSKLPGHIPPKARFAPSQEGALGLFYLPTRLAVPILAQYQRVLHAGAPSQVHSLSIEALRA